MIFDPESTEMEDETWEVLEKAATAAAENGHLEIVRLVLPQFGELDPCCVVAWSVIDTAAANGHLGVCE